MSTKLWFPPNGSAHQRAADADVTARFGPQLAALENTAVDDIDGDAGAVDGAADWADFAAGARRAVARILVLDQVSRHVHRHHPRRGDADGGDPVGANDVRALALAHTLLGTGAEAGDTAAGDIAPGYADRARALHLALSVPEHVFALMPLRHARPPTAARLRAVVSAVDARLAHEDACKHLLLRFRRATVSRLTDAEMRGGGRAGGGDAGAAGGEHADEDLLEHMPAPPGPGHDAAAAAKARARHAVHKTVAAFIRTRAQAWRAARRAQATEATDAAGDVGSGGPLVLAVSLSGGVDSMVLARILVDLRDSPSFLASCGIGGGGGGGGGGGSPSSFAVEVAAVHIDYANRAESGAEAAFVARWCAQYGIDLTTRVVSEVKRGVTKRDEYEKRSRAIRYGTYAAVLASHAGGRCPAVLFGHHQGDVQENVVSNAMRGASLLDLSGMADASVVNGVRVWRPLLAHGKDAIFAYAHAHGVPYFKDTTPDWSTRGKLRNKLLPLLAELYGDGFARNLSQLARASRQVGEVVEASLLGPFMRDGVTRARSGFCARVDCAPWRAQPPFFWKEALMRVCHAMGWSAVRDQSVAQLLLKLRPERDAARRRRKGNQPRAHGALDGWLALHPRARCLLHGGELYIFAGCAFPDARGPVCGFLEGANTGVPRAVAAAPAAEAAAPPAAPPAAPTTAREGSKKGGKKGKNKAKRLKAEQQKAERVARRRAVLRVAPGRAYAFGPWRVTLVPIPRLDVASRADGGRAKDGGAAYTPWLWGWRLGLTRNEDESRAELAQRRLRQVATGSFSYVLPARIAADEGTRALQLVVGHHCPPSFPADLCGDEGEQVDAPLRGLETKLRAALPLVYAAVSKEAAAWAAAAPEAAAVDGGGGASAEEDDGGWDAVRVEYEFTQPGTGPPP